MQIGVHPGSVRRVFLLHNAVSLVPLALRRPPEGRQRQRKALRVRFKTWSRVTKLSQHEADGGKFQEREGVAVEIFPVLGETATTIEPCDGSFNDPALG